MESLKEEIKRLTSDQVYIFFLLDSTLSLLKKKKQTQQAFKSEAFAQSNQMIQEKIESLEKALKEGEERHQIAQQHSQDRERKLELNVEELTQALGVTQREVEEKNNELSKMKTELQSNRATFKNIKQELAEYKARATKVLQEKENTIKELTERLASPNSQEVSLGEFVQLQQQRDSLQSDVEEMKQRNQQLQATLAVKKKMFFFFSIGINNYS